MLQNDRISIERNKVEASVARRPSPQQETEAQDHRTAIDKGKVEASVARRLRAPPERAKPLRS